MKKKSKIIIAAAVVIISLTILLWSLSPPESQSVRDIVDDPDEFIGKNIQIKGLVENNTITNGTNSVTFKLADEKEQEYNVTIFYEGTAPNNFQGGKTVFIKGTLERDEDDNLLFKADKIIVGCPSKYD
jgi:cytochrome c-type biogenesis protein CcmE